MKTLSFCVFFNIPSRLRADDFAFSRFFFTWWPVLNTLQLFKLPRLFTYYHNSEKMPMIFAKTFGINVTFASANKNRYFIGPGPNWGKQIGTPPRIGVTPSNIAVLLRNMTSSPFTIQLVTCAPWWLIVHEAWSVLIVVEGCSASAILTHSNISSKKQLYLFLISVLFFLCTQSTENA